ncbi:MAG: bifunctional alpha/beta hydrolase/OsmC family protein [Salibacteraceae bacterium]
MKSEKLSISNKSGTALHAVLELPPNQHPTHYAMFAHCFTCSSNLNAVRNVSRSLANQGFGVVRFDFTGLGKSEGAFADSHFSGNVSDLICVAEHIKQHYSAPKLIVGHSLGGAASIVAASKLDYIEAVATIAAPSSVQHTKKHFSHGIEELSEKGAIEVNIGGRPFKIDSEFVKDFDNTDLLKVVKELRKPILIMHAPFDKTVAIQSAQELYTSSMHPKSFISLDGADHLLTEKRDSEYVGDVIGSWVKRYFPPVEAQRLSTEGEQLVGRLNLVEDNFTTSIQTNKHSIVADEPEEVGGDDFGPAPYELLGASLIACTAMTIKLYAERKEWPLTEVEVFVSHSKKHRDDADSGSAKLDHLQKKLRFHGDLSDDQRERLKEIASKCPVHRTLLTEVVIETELLD